MSRLISRILFVILCFAATSRADVHVVSVDPALERSNTATPSAREHSAIERFYGKKIESVDPVDPEARWNYIAPNEHYNHLFEACLPKEGGAYISVGTFRGMNVASSGKVSHLVLMDIDTSALIFNKINAQLIAKAKDRFEYLSLLFSGVPQPALEKEAREGKLLDHDFIDRLRDTVLPSDILATWKETTKLDIPQADIDQLNKNYLKYNYGPTKISTFTLRMKEDMVRELKSYSQGGFGDKTFFGSNERFDTLKRMISEDRVTVVPGNIAGNRTMASLVDLFNEKDMKVAGMDISNVPQYLIEADQENAFSNIRKLPFREDGRVFLTTGSSRYQTNKPRKDDGWEYYSFHHKNIIKPYSRSNFPSVKKKDGSGEDANIVSDPSNPKEFNLLYTPEDAPCK
jgi:hypothetical protein